mmetsp:Transcript_16998/g.43941  ORF Transcript_16998/g.43941 Transcript_16998/m.43941 type:complete len:260 (+) Transcript_16998:1011-1790(+)
MKWCPGRRRRRSTPPTNHRTARHRYRRPVRTLMVRRHRHHRNGRARLRVPTRPVGRTCHRLADPRQRTGRWCSTRARPSMRARRRSSSAQTRSRRCARRRRGLCACTRPVPQTRHSRCRLTATRSARARSRHAVRTTPWCPSALAAAAALLVLLGRTRTCARVQRARCRGCPGEGLNGTRVPSVWAQRRAPTRRATQTPAWAAELWMAAPCRLVATVRAGPLSLRARSLRATHAPRGGGGTTDALAQMRVRARLRRLWQ